MDPSAVCSPMPNHCARWMQGVGLAWLVVLFVTLAHCSADEPCPRGRCVDGGLDARHDGDETIEMPTDAEIGADGPVVSAGDLLDLEIDPRNPVVTSVNGMPVTQSFRALGVRRDGSRVVLSNGVWSLEHHRLGDLSRDGVFTASGLAAGTVQVQVEAPGHGGRILRATTTLTVRLRREDMGAGAPPDAAARFAEAMTVSDPARAARILYPLQGAVMPNNVAPPNIQWERGAMGDLYRVRISKPNVTVTAYVLHTGTDFRYNWLVDRTAWRTIAESDLDEPATITVDRWEASTRQVIAGLPVQIRLARGSIFGAVYYWNLGAGRMQRINAVTGANENVVPNPPRRTSDGVRCIACHTVSRDGRYLAAEVTAPSGYSGNVYDLTADLSADPPPTVMSTRAFACASFNPDASLLIACDGWSGALRVVHARTGMSVTATGLPTMRATQPEWSPDGNNVAFITNVSVNGDQYPIAGDLALLPVVERDPLQFGAPIVLHRGADLAMGVPAGNTDSFPTWSPDSRWIAFQHGPGSFSMQGAGALYLISRDGGTPRRLDNANGGPSGADAYRPTFSPYMTTEPGGRRYYWLAFFSRRDYGNAQAGTRGTRRRQLWVTAIDASAGPGEDPSRVPYWLPGQDVTTENMAAYWAPEACRMNGSECRVSSECCSGSCRPDPMNPMRFTCQAPPPAECRRRGQTCGGSSDCCEGLMCVGNVCDVPPG